MRTQQQAGFTLVELLVSFVIVVVLLGFITELFRNSRNTYDRQEEIADRQQAQLISIGQLSYEVALAGYKGTDTTTGRNFTGSTFNITKGTTSDSLTVRYYEDRYLEAGTVPEEQVIQFSVVDNTLLRTDLNDPDAEPLDLVDGVGSLQLINYLNREGDKLPREATPGTQDVSGLILELTFNNSTLDKTTDDTTQQISIGFDNIQQESTTTVVQN